MQIHDVVTDNLSLCKTQCRNADITLRKLCMWNTVANDILACLILKQGNPLYTPSNVCIRDEEQLYIAS